MATALLLTVSARAAGAPVSAQLAASVLAADGAKAAAMAAPDVPLFIWPHQTDLGAVLDLTLGGFEGQRKVEVYAVLFAEPLSGPAPEKRAERALAKLKGEHLLAAGEQRIAFPGLWHTDEFPGRHRFRLEVEADVKGAPKLQQTLRFATDGPPPPAIDIISIDAFAANAGQSSDQFHPGDPVDINVLFSITGNAARHGPRLTLRAVMDADEYADADDPAFYPEPPNADSYDLPAQDGEYQLVAHAGLPVYFAEAWDVRHPFTVQVELNPGTEHPATGAGHWAVTDYYPGETRRSPDLGPRLIQLDRALKWDVRLRRPAVPEPPAARP
jgi:hypothetical protein